MSPNPHTMEKEMERQAPHDLMMALELEAEEILNPEEPFTTVAEDILPHQLDSIAWNHRHNLFAFGSYEIDQEDSGRRLGNIYLATICHELAVGYKMLQKIENLPGILDLKWEPASETALVAATSESVIVFSLEPDERGLELTPLKLSQSDSLLTKPHMALYVTWLNSSDLIFSDSAGNITRWTRNKDNFEVDEESGELHGITSCPLHKYFVWFVHFDAENELIFSGDDCGFFRGFHVAHLKTPSLHFKYKFETGVTSILTKGDIVAVGCYDEQLRIFTRSLEEGTRIVRLSAPLLEIDLKGTVWRTMWVPALPTQQNSSLDPNVYKMAVAAGRNGIHVVQFDRSNWSWETMFCCLDHRGSLAYGIDIHPNEETLTVATCYFDLHILHIFNMKP